MTEDRLNSLFQDLRNQDAETSIQEVNKWIGIAAASAGLIGLLAYFKLSVLLTKKGLIMLSTFIVTMGTVVTLTVLAHSDKTKNHQEPIKESLVHYQQKNEIPDDLVPEVKEAEQKRSIYPVETEKIVTSDVQYAEEFSLRTSKLSPFTFYENKNLSKERFDFTDSEDLEPFKNLELSSALEIVLIQGTKNSIRIETAKSEDKKQLSIKQTGETLKLSVQRKFKNDPDIKVYLTFTDLDYIESSGAIDITSENEMNLDHLKLELEGAASIELKLNCELLDVNISGAADLELKGAAKQFKISNSGACDIGAYDFIVDYCELNLAGASDMRLNVKNNFKIEGKGAASISYKGDPTLENTAPESVVITKKK